MPIPLLDLRALHDEIRSDLDGCWHEVTSRELYVGGPEVDRFEAAWAAYCSRRFGVGTANGTDALELVLRGLGIGPGDEVVVPANTFVATCEAVTSAGAVPVFADVDPVSLLLTGETLQPVITARTAAVIVVHLFGHVVDMADVGRVAGAAGLAVVEDAAQAHGARWAGRAVGSFGVASAFSFYPGKNLGALGDAGAVVTDDAALAARIRSIANHGRTPASHTEHAVDGRNSRLDSLQAAVLSAKLARLDRWNEARRQVAAWYRCHLPSGVELVEPLEASTPVHHLAVVRVPFRDEVRAALTEAGIGTGIHYPTPCHRQPAFARHARGALPAAETAAGEILSLPMFPHLTEAGVSAVARCLEGVAGLSGDGPR